jgi:LPS O-antigen subunit length determinant protein (WzzB/FepE family)
VVEEPVVPLTKSKPKTARVVLIWLFLGMVVGPVWVLGERIVGEAKKRWAEKN